MIHNKLVRDRIPEIITSRGEIPITRQLCGDDFRKELNRKLQEEVDEFCSSGEIEELIDILEVVHTIADSMGANMIQVERMQRAKRLKRGGFSSRTFLVETHNHNPIKNSDGM